MTYSHFRTGDLNYAPNFFHGRKWVLQSNLVGILRSDVLISSSKAIEYYLLLQKNI